MAPVARKQHMGAVLSLARPGAWTDAVAAEQARLALEERAVIEAVLAGHVHAFRRLVDRYQRRVRAVIARLVGNPADGDELAQQTFLQAFHRLRDFQLDLRFSAWLYRIAINLAKDHLKSKKRSEAPTGGDQLDSADGLWCGAIEGPDAHLERSQRRQALELAIGALPLKYREVLILRDVEELTYEEIQAVLDLPVTTLKIRVVRARERLRELLGQEARP